MVRTLTLTGAAAAALALAGAAIAQQPAAPSRFEALFQTRCAGCHDPAVERAPARSMIAQMTPGQIRGALEGVMAPMAAGLSREDIQGLAAHLSTGSQGQQAAAGPRPPAAIGRHARASPSRSRSG